MVLDRARSVLGVRFRPQGRDPAFGLDCVGLVAWATGLDAVPADYALRGGDAHAIAALVDRFARRVDAAEPGDVLLLAAGAAQFHLAVTTGDGVIHADAALRRVVERPGPPPWPVLGIWRLNPERID
ncbi:peptidoglycan endopeptidase [uncultured Sphingomonas sp.]|uniref:peptidoglycan endopeptidase n=1 Tax=uncultured Sphingomonas sp. TaxID=158754 RepID=UPI0035CCA6D8